MYRGNQYHLFNRKITVAPGETPGVRQQFSDGVINLGLDSIEQEVGSMSDKDIEEHITGLIMIHQYTLNKGLELYGDKAEKATVKEFTQIQDMDTYTPMDASKLTREQKTKALSSLLFLTEKRDGRIKARQCAVGSKQRTFEGYNKADGSSLTISTDGLLISAAIDGHENRSVLCLDIPGAFLNADNDEFVLMCLRGEMAEMMVKVDPTIYRKYVT